MFTFLIEFLFEILIAFSIGVLLCLLFGFLSEFSLFFVDLLVVFCWVGG